MKKMNELFNNLATAKNFLCTAIGATGAALFGALGGYTPTLSFFFFFMVADYIIGIVVAVLKLSKKTETGGLNSSVGFIGLVKKGGILVMVWIGYQVDVTFNLNIARHMIILGFLANEVISVIENLGLLGVVKNDAVIKVIDILKKQTNITDTDKESEDK